MSRVRYGKPGPIHERGASSPPRLSALHELALTERSNVLLGCVLDAKPATRSGKSMIRLFLMLAVCLSLTVAPASAAAGAPKELQVGVAGHAFDHLGSIGEQAETAVASGANIIYVSGIGPVYLGLSSPEEMARQQQAATTYLRNAKHHGIRLAIGYSCATSIVK